MAVKGAKNLNRKAFRMSLAIAVVANILVAAIASGSHNTSDPGYSYAASRTWSMVQMITMGLSIVGVIAATKMGEASAHVASLEHATRFAREFVDFVRRNASDYREITVTSSQPRRIEIKTEQGEMTFDLEQQGYPLGSTFSIDSLSLPFREIAIALGGVLERGYSGGLYSYETGDYLIEEDALGRMHVSKETKVAGDRVLTRLVIRSKSEASMKRLLEKAQAEADSDVGKWL